VHLKKRRPTSLGPCAFFISPSASTGGHRAYSSGGWLLCWVTLAQWCQGKSILPCLLCGANSQICLARAVFQRPRRTPQMTEEQKKSERGWDSPRVAVSQSLLQPVWTPNCSQSWLKGIRDAYTLEINVYKLYMPISNIMQLTYKHRNIDFTVFLKNVYL
jgi:hypothetical protein